VRERYVLFKGEDMPEELGEDVGPVYVVHSEKPRQEEERGWMSRSQAKQLAAELGYALEIDGPWTRSFSSSDSPTNQRTTRFPSRLRMAPP
jgi:hypothetical protein